MIVKHCYDLFLTSLENSTKISKNLCLGFVGEFGVFFFVRYKCYFAVLEVCRLYCDLRTLLLEDCLFMPFFLFGLPKTVM